MARLAHWTWTWCRWKQCRTMSNSLNTITTRSLSAKTCVDQQYEEAVQALNSLQTNAAELQRTRQDRVSLIQRNLVATQSYLSKVGVSLDDIDKLSVVHVAGTKGKGSTCAFTESILREHGYRTGFYSSPHLVAARERIRINGQPVSKETFTKHFWDVYNRLLESKESASDMPAYFKFLTVLALKVFVREGVDVAILEVGIGGEYDCTNIVRKPVVCGISSLDLDHTSLLGSNIESIAWHKAGIMKCGIPTFTVHQHYTSSIPILSARAKERNCPLYVVPPLESYGWGARPLQLGMAGTVQYDNASLALQLAQYWLNSKKDTGTEDMSEDTVKQWGQLSVASSFTLSDEDVTGLRTTVWPGRSQVMSRDHITFFIDGAHTNASMQACVDWFTKAAPLHIKSTDNTKTYRVLFFNSTGDRDPETLLKFLSACNFDLAVFTTNLVTTSINASSDQTNYTISQDQMHLRCERQRSSWIRLIRRQNKDGNKTDDKQLDSVLEQMKQSSGDCEQSEDKFKQSMQSHSVQELDGKLDKFKHSSMQSTSVQDEKWEEELDENLAEMLPASDVPSIIFPCIQDALFWLSCGRSSDLKGELLTPPAFPPPQQLQDADQVQVLVTGSLHLVGGVLSIIDPGLSCTTNINTANKSSSLTDLVLNNYASFSSPGAP